jgi:tRNA nucleotidyltransferase/poly(A) polymerase
MVFNIKPYERKIFELISITAEELGYPAYVVGGYVRDRILARESKDIDIVCVGSGIRLAEALAAKLRPIPRIAVYRRFGTAMIKHKDLEIEFVGARKESYNHDSRKPVVEEGSLEDDQNRRDFTINAMAVSLNKQDFGHIIDPFGGIYDIEKKNIQTPLEPGKTFSDDPLRMMRAIRFASQLGFVVHPETLEAIEKYRFRIGIVSNERITTEFNKILLSDQPSIGLKLLHETKLLDLVLPELAALHGVEYRDGKGHKDNFYHTLQVVDNVAKATKTNKNIWLLWATLLHDIAKPPTKRFDPNHGWTFHGHEVVGARWVPKIFKRMSLPLDVKMKYVQKLVRLHLRPISLTHEDITDSAIRRLLFDAGEDIDDLLTLCNADVTSKNEKKVARIKKNYETVKKKLIEVEEKDKIRNWQPPITGEFIMKTFNMQPCREVGIIKDSIREAILDGHIKNSFEEAKSYMLQKGEELGFSVARQ